MKGSAIIWFGAVVVLAIGGSSTACGGTTSAGGGWLAGVRTDDMTSYEKNELERSLHTFASPCAEVTVPVAQCLEEKRPCKACVPAAAFVAAAIKSGRSEDQVEAAYRARFDPAMLRTIDLTGSPSKGPAGAPVTIVEFADYQCPGCAAAVAILDRLVDGYAPNVRLVFKHYPLQSHPQADLAARASVAAMNQGKFWELHHTMYRNRTALQQDEIESYAMGLGLDVARFRTDMVSPSVRKLVDRDRDQGDALNIRGTPAVFINGREFSFELFDFGGEDLLAWVELEIELATGRAVTRPTSVTRAEETAPAPPASAGAPPEAEN